MATSLITAVLEPILAPGPGAPPESPLLWTYWAWARRQSTQDVTYQTPDPQSVQTTQMEPLPAAEVSPADEANNHCEVNHRGSSRSPRIAEAAAQGDVSAAAQRQAGLPADFERTTIVSGPQPTDGFPIPARRPHPDRRKGRRDQGLRTTATATDPVITLAVLPTDTDEERGLLGIEVDPDFSQNGYLYVSYTTAENHDRLSRITVTGDTADPASEVVLLESDQLGNVFHHGGEIHFGPDGKLYWAMGITRYNPNSQNLSNIHGKILRLNPGRHCAGRQPVCRYAGRRYRRSGRTVCATRSGSPSRRTANS